MLLCTPMQDTHFKSKENFSFRSYVDNRIVYVVKVLDSSRKNEHYNGSSRLSFADARRKAIVKLKEFAAI